MLGGAAGAPLLNYNVTNSATRAADDRTVQNMNATNAQCVSQAAGSLGYSTSTGADNDTAIETNAGTTLVLAAQLTLGTEQVILKSYRVEIIRMSQ